jgi:acyl-CoA synthetase (AMP-forming)/AMP-acid ligase II
MMMGGGFSPVELIKAWRERFPHIHLTNAYGQTESGPCITDYWDKDILEKPNAVGKPSRHVKVKIVDDTGTELPIGQVGEITYKVPSVMKGYYKDPELTAQTIKRGWAHSGDIGFIDKEGYVYIVDRKKDIIIRGGTNISSMEVEQVIYKDPAVLEAAVIGIPHPILGEAVMAVVVTKEGHQLTEESLRELCKRYLADFKVPSRVGFVKELPRNPGGKVLKRVLRDQFSGQSG